MSLTVTQITPNGILYTNSNVWKKRNWIFRENSVVNWYSDKTKHCMMFAFIKLFMCKTNSVTSDVVNEQTKSHKFSIKHCKRDGKTGGREDRVRELTEHIALIFLLSNESTLCGTSFRIHEYKVWIDAAVAVIFVFHLHISMWEFISKLFYKLWIFPHIIVYWDGWTFLAMTFLIRLHYTTKFFLLSLSISWVCVYHGCA